MSNRRGLSIWSTSVFIIGNIAGAGVVALPKAAEDVGWIGVPLIALGCCLSAYTGVKLGKVWLLTERIFPVECGGKGHVQDPYPLIAEKTYGKLGRSFISFGINFTLFGYSTVYLLLAAQNIQILVDHFDKSLSFCYGLLILAGVLLPFSWLGTPKEFWPLAVGACLATGAACVLLIINMSLHSKDIPDVVHSNPTFTDFSVAFGTIVSAIAGHPTFPTFQMDMKNQEEFKWAVIIAFISISLMYLPVTAVGYFVYGNLLKYNLLQTLPPKETLSVIVQIAITLHLLLAFLIPLNPVSQNLESWLKIPNGFSWRRCFVRTILVALSLFIAESIPHFGAVFSLMGGVYAILSFVCPCLFYHKICNMYNQEVLDTINIPLWEKVLDYEVIFIGIAGGIAATVSAITVIVSPDTFVAPCYINITKASLLN